MDREILSRVNTRISIEIRIILIQIIGGLRCNNEWTINNNVMCFVLNNERQDPDRNQVCEPVRDPNNSIIRVNGGYN